MPYGPPLPIHNVFQSKKEVLDHWRRLTCTMEAINVPKPIGGTENLDILYAPGHGWRYVVSLATPDDARALCGLSDEFVRNHEALFPEYKDVAHRRWCEYLGLHADAAKRRQEVASTTSRSALQASQFVFHALCAAGGCMLKCEAVPNATTSGGAMGSASNLAGFGTPPRRLRKQLSTSSTGSGASASGSAAEKQPLVVGYVHFTMEDGTSPDAPRKSKRLKRKRGESTEEYTKVSHLLVTKAHRGNGIGQLLLTAVMHRVCRLDPSFSREIFLTVVKRNERAVRLYQGLGLRMDGLNITYLSKDTSLPVEWYQMIMKCESLREEASEGDLAQNGVARGDDLSSDASGS
mmetsp:Transcript_41647/g.90814  ORF Transcript_41647/g.90814 Transcript_41647/m.90814 type:complete len:349 (-) Transcript_41647:103-1149(-)